MSVGYATCLNGGCENFEIPHEIEVVTSTISHRASDLPVTVTENEYWHPVDDADTRCEQCGQPCALARELPPKYPKMVA